MLGRLARFAIRRRRPILVVAAGFVVAAGALGGGVAKYLSSGGFNDPNSQSSRAEDRLQAVFHTSEPNLILLVSARHGEVKRRTRPSGVTNVVAEQTHLERF